MHEECKNCKFLVDASETVGGACPNCQFRPEPDQPTPVNSDFDLRDMPDPDMNMNGVGEDTGGNPLAEGILGGWQHRQKRDESFPGFNTASREASFWENDPNPLYRHAPAPNHDGGGPWDDGEGNLNRTRCSPCNGSGVEWSFHSEDGNHPVCGSCNGTGADVRTATSYADARMEADMPWWHTAAGEEQQQPAEEEPAAPQNPHEMQMDVVGQPEVVAPGDGHTVEARVHPQLGFHNAVEIGVGMLSSAFPGLKLDGKDATPDVISAYGESHCGIPNLDQLPPIMVSHPDEQVAQIAAQTIMDGHRGAMSQAYPEHQLLGMNHEGEIALPQPGQLHDKLHNFLGFFSGGPGGDHIRVNGKKYGVNPQAVQQEISQTMAPSVKIHARDPELLAAGQDVADRADFTRAMAWHGAQGQRAAATKESIVPAVAVGGAAALRAAAPTIMRAAMGAGKKIGPKLMGGAKKIINNPVVKGIGIGKGIGMGLGDIGGGGASAPPMTRSLQQMSHQKVAEGWHPSSDDFTSPEAKDNGELKHDGDNSAWQKDFGVNGVGGTDEGANGLFGSSDMGLFDENLPHILTFATSDEDGSMDEIVQKVHEFLEGLVPGYLDHANDDDLDHGESAPMIDDGSKREETVEDMDNDLDGGNDRNDRNDRNASNGPLFPPCRKCGEVAGFGTFPGSQTGTTAWCLNGACQDTIGWQDLAKQYNDMMAGASADMATLPETEHPLGDHTGRTANDHQGPHTPEQKEAVADLLRENGREKEIPNMRNKPWHYADELAQVQNRMNPPEGPDADEPPAIDPNMMMQGMDPSQQGGMPMPGMDANQMMMQAARRYAEVHEHGDLHEDVNVEGVNVADQEGPRDVEMEQDTTHTWVDDSGNPLQVGQEYELHSNQYDIPDIVQITAVKPDSITYEIQGEWGLGHGVEITHDEAESYGYTFTQTAAGDTGIENPGDDSSLEENMDSTYTPAPGEQTDLSRPSVVQASVTKLADALLGYDPASNGDDTKQHANMPRPKRARWTPGNRGRAVRINKRWHTWPVAEPTQDNPTGGLMHGEYIQQFRGVDQTDGFCEITPEGQIISVGNGGVHNNPSAVMQLQRVHPELVAPDNGQQPPATQGEGFDVLGQPGGAQEFKLGSKTAGQKFTPMEQRDFIDEQGFARNHDKLQLSGTHYESKVDPMDADDMFLFM